MRDDAVLERHVLFAPILRFLLGLRHLRSGFRVQGFGRIPGLGFRGTRSFDFRVTRNPVFAEFRVQDLDFME